VHHVQGAQQMVTEVYLIGDTASLDLDDMASLAGVERAVRVSREYRVLGRHRNDRRPTSWEYRGVRFGQDTLNVFAGLCAVDTPEHVERMLAVLRDHGQVCTRMGAYKPRTNPYSFQGHGKSCLPYVFELAGKYGMQVIAMEVTHEDHVSEIHEALREAGGGLGSAGFIVFDETRNMVDVAARYARFLHVESCGQCNPCKAGTREITIGFEALVEGDVSLGPLDRIARATQTVTDGSRCFLPTQAMIVSSSILRSFPEDVAERSSGIGGRHDVPLPLITAMDGSEVRIDPNADYYRADWTRAEQPVRIRPANR
jgi:hypothetical protein